jgi:hypothetical protein
MDPTRIAGMFDDDGYEIIPDLITKPSLCLTCLKVYEPGLEDNIGCHKFSGRYFFFNVAY